MDFLTVVRSFWRRACLHLCHVIVFVVTTGLLTSAHATYTVKSAYFGNSWILPQPTCTELGKASSLNPPSVLPGGYVATCATETLIAGTVIKWYTGATYVGDDTVASVTVYCATGTHYDSSTNTCADDVTVALASCLPSIRTIAPCPSGFAPTNAMPTGSSGPSSYPSIFDNMSVQDVLVAGFYLGVFVLGMRNGRAKQP